MATEFTRMIAVPLPEGWDWNSKLMVWGTAPYPRSLVMSARLGNQEVEGIAISSTREGFSGYLKQQPDPADTLTVTFPGEEPVDTGLTLSTDLPNA